MNVKEIAYISIKVLAVFVFIKFISYFNGLFSVFNMVLSSDTLSQTGVFTQTILIVGPTLLFLVVSMCLWLYADEFSDRMVKGLEVREKVSVNFEDLQSVAFSVVGVVIIADALPMLISAIIRSRMMNLSQPIDIMISIGSQGLKLLMGIWLFLGSQGIVGFIRNSKTAGLKK